MKFKQHIMISKHIMNWLEGEDSIKIGIDLDKKSNRVAYLLGSVAPDFNCIYPAHRLSDTWLRYKRRIHMEQSVKREMLKAYLLGIITHYTCDYFCYAHNNKSTGYHHKVYEKNLIRTSINENECKEWDKTEIREDRGFDILGMVKYLNAAYRETIQVDKHKGWDMDKEQCKMDLKYADMAIKNVLLMLSQDSHIAEVKSKKGEQRRVVRTA